MGEGWQIAARRNDAHERAAQRMLIAVIALLLAASGPSSSCDAHGVYSRVREAMGGPRWDGVAEIVSSGTVVTSGMHGTFVRATSLKDGRSSLEMTVNRQQTADVYDGTTDWQQDYSRGVHPLDSPNARAAAITAAYLDRNGPWSSAYGDAEIACLGTSEENGRTFDVFKITPHSGTPAEQWVDSKTNLVDRTIVETPTSTTLTKFSDYQPVQGVLVPFRVQTATVGDPTSEEIFSTESVEVRSQVVDEDFRRPPDPTDTRMLGTSGAITVPIAIEAGDIIVNAYINGKGPFPFILDTGGHAILTPEAAAEIGLKTEGAGSSGGGGSGRVGLSYAFVDSLRIGDAEVPNQPFLVIPYDNDFSDRGSKPPLAGILGLELFERFAIRIDYGNSQLTLTPLSTFRYSGGGARAPIVFQEDEPLTTAEADQVSGLFGVDTGNSGALIMFEKFLRENGFLHRYAQGSATTGSGTGGKVQLVRHTIGSFSLGGQTFRDAAHLFRSRPKRRRVLVDDRSRKPRL